MHAEWNILPYSTPRIQLYELRMRSSGRLDTCIETARNEPVCLATAVRELVLQAVFCSERLCIGRLREGRLSQSRSSRRTSRTRVVLSWRSRTRPGERAPPTRSESFGVDSSSAMVVFPITEVKRHGFALSNDHHHSCSGPGCHCCSHLFWC